MLRTLSLLALLVFVSCLPARSEPPSTPAASYAAGILKLSVPDADGPFDTMVWYPTSDNEKPWQAGPFIINASLNATVAQGQRLPIVVLSHGSGGTPLAHRELAASLARSGFVVVAPVHLGDAAGHPRAKQQAQVLRMRPRQALEALNAVLGDSRFSERADADRLGMIGYSAGGYTALIVAGAHPDFKLVRAYCTGEGRGDVGSCRPAEHDAAQAIEQLQDWKTPTEPRLKVLVLLDPLSMPFDKAGLASLKIPIMLFRPQDDSYLNAAHNALALSRDLPSPPMQIVVPGRHFVFIDPCPEKLMTEARPICEDMLGIDRPSIHREIESDVATFLHEHL